MQQFINGVLYDLSQPAVWSIPWEVHIGGADRTGILRPYLIDISVTDKAGITSDACSLTIDDTDGQIRLDMEGLDISVILKGYEVFSGVIENARSTGSRGGGRLIPVSAKGFDTRGKAKEIQSFHKDDATLGEFLEQAAKNAGYSIRLDPALANIKAPYWAAHGESFLDIGERMAREIHGTFKLRGNQAVLVKRGSSSLPSVDAIVADTGGNVINWDIAPFTGRGVWKKAKSRYFDRKAAKWIEEEIEIDAGDDAPDSANVIRLPSADKDQAQRRIKGRKGEAKREKGGGNILLDLAPQAQAESILNLSGAKPDIDGPWRMESVNHRANRSGGSTTAAELKEPGAK
ncbi:late control D family protein [Rhizobium sp. FKY42]|uniref:phage late control D family protein n=1 Tax=Rhizobium sp. FKY42 TaxID=2562310 RepID=UPI0010C04347|nr:late control D family protein [Rhizobium sp. FKY42]